MVDNSLGRRTRLTENPPRYPRVSQRVPVCFKYPWVFEFGTRDELGIYPTRQTGIFYVAGIPAGYPGIFITGSISSAAGGVVRHARVVMLLVLLCTHSGRLAGLKI